MPGLVLSSVLTGTQCLRQTLRSTNPIFTAIRQESRRSFRYSARLAVIKPYLLADIGEGITECQIIQWFVQPGARVAQFDKICEVQSDKAAVEITSRFDGVIKKLHYEADDMAKVGGPLVDIDIDGEISEEDVELVKTPEEKAEGSVPPPETQKYSPAVSKAAENPKAVEPRSAKEQGIRKLAIPSVRYDIKAANINIEDVPGTGKDGRVTKEDLATYMRSKQNGASSRTSSIPTGEDRAVQFTPIQKAMYQAMTHSLTIPHFLYSDNINFTSLNHIRRSLNAESAQDAPKLSALPFIIKAVSLAFLEYPALNAHLDTKDPSNPKFTHKAAHNIGFAVDTPHGLMVPVIHNVQSHSITSLASEISRLGNLARNNKLTSPNLSGATFSVSNIGAIGGTTMAPIIVAPQVGILAVGKARAVPAFDGEGNVVRREEAVFSWSADHRAVDGATVARCSELVRGLLENVYRMTVRL